MGYGVGEIRNDFRNARGECRFILNENKNLYIYLTRDNIQTQPTRSNTMSNKHNFQIRIDKELFDRVRALAEAEDRTISAQMHKMLREGLDREQRK